MATVWMGVEPPSVNSDLAGEDDVLIPSKLAVTGSSLVLASFTHCPHSTPPALTLVSFRGQGGSGLEPGMNGRARTLSGNGGLGLAPRDPDTGVVGGLRGRLGEPAPRV